MSGHDDLEKRLIDVESLLAHHEETIRDLSDVLARQWAMIDRLAGKLERLESRLDEEFQPRSGEPEGPPPHY